MAGVTPRLSQPRVAIVKAPAVESRQVYIGLTRRHAVHIHMNDVALCSGERATLLEMLTAYVTNERSNFLLQALLRPYPGRRCSRSQCSHVRFIEPERRFKLNRKK